MAIKKFPKEEFEQAFVNCKIGLLIVFFFLAISYYSYNKYTNQTDNYTCFRFTKDNNGNIKYKELMVCMSSSVIAGVIGALTVLLMYIIRGQNKIYTSKKILKDMCSIGFILFSFELFSEASGFSGWMLNLFNKDPPETISISEDLKDTCNKKQGKFVDNSFSNALSITFLIFIIIFFIFQVIIMGLTGIYGYKSGENR